MIKLIWQRLAIFQRAEFLSARDLLQRAGAISGLFLLVHLAGFREFTGVLNGTIGSLALGWNLSAFLAVIFIALYLAFVILAPILVLAAMILTTWQHFLRKNEASSPKP
jgi:membrane protein implicated in regulation of membrane protease activity